MREHARLHVACSVDVQVAAPASDAAADKLAIVLEVKREQGLLLAHFANEAVEVLTLVGVHHKRGGRADADGHVREDPREKRPLLDEPVEELLAGDGTCVGAGVAARYAEGQAVFAQKLHGAGNLGVRPLAAAGVGCLLEALDADGGHEIGDADHILHELLVDERRVGERQERAIGMRFAQVDEVVLADERLAAGVDVDVGSQLDALVDDGVDFLVGEVLLVTVFCCPASGAAQVAGARRIEQDGPGDVAAIPIAHRFLFRPCEHVRVNDERLDETVPDLGIHVGENLHDKLMPIRFVIDCLMEGGALGGEHVVGRNFVDHVHDLRDVSFGVFKQVVDGFVEGCPLDLVGCFHDVVPPIKLFNKCGITFFSVSIVR